MSRQLSSPSLRALGWAAVCLTLSFTALPSWGSDPQVPSVGEPPLGFYPVSPHRIEDTRSDPPGLVPGVPRKLLATHSGTFPSTAKAVVLNITALEPHFDGHLSVYFGDTVPNTATLNYSAGRTQTALVIVGLEPSGLYTLLATQPGGPALLQVTIDALGYFQ